MIDIRLFLDVPSSKIGSISNECALQLELGCYLRDQGHRVEFEKTFSVQSLASSTRKPKQNLDLFVFEQERTVGIELKVPVCTENLIRR